MYVKKNKCLLFWCVSHIPCFGKIMMDCYGIQYVREIEFLSVWIIDNYLVMLIFFFFETMA